MVNLFLPTPLKIIALITKLCLYDIFQAVVHHVSESEILYIYTIHTIHNLSFKSHDCHS